ncbi:hypothetical protein CAI22_14350 [Acinetobacter johnsonii]|nr:hypothetical protein [Acinetobacter johnsonii]
MLSFTPYLLQMGMSITDKKIIFLTHIDVVAMLFTILISCYLEIWDKIQDESWKSKAVTYYLYVCGLMISVYFFQFKTKGLSLDNSHTSIFLRDYYDPQLLKSFWIYTFIVVSSTLLIIVVKNFHAGGKQ